MKISSFLIYLALPATLLSSVQFIIISNDQFTLFIDDMFIDTWSDETNPLITSIDLSQSVHSLRVSIESTSGIGFLMAQINLPDGTSLLTDTSGEWETANGDEISLSCPNNAGVDQKIFFYDYSDQTNRPGAIWPGEYCNSTGLWDVLFNFTVPAIPPESNIEVPVIIKAAADDRLTLYYDSQLLGYTSVWNTALSYLVNSSAGYHEISYLVRNTIGPGAFLAQVLINETLYSSNPYGLWTSYLLGDSPNNANSLNIGYDQSYQGDLPSNTFFPSDDLIDSWTTTDYTGLLTWVVKFNFTIPSSDSSTTTLAIITTTNRSQTTFLTLQSSATTAYLSSATLQETTALSSQDRIFSSINLGQSLSSANRLAQRLEPFSFLTQASPLIIILVLLAFAILFLTCGYFLGSWSQRRSIRRKSNLNSQHGLTAYKSNGTDVFKAHEDPCTNLTAVPSSMGVYVPAFLEFKFGQDYFVNNRIGAGSFGTVSLATAINPELQTYGSQIVTKISNRVKHDDHSHQIFLQEVSLTYFLRDHQNIVKILGYSERPETIILKFYRYGSLDNFLAQSKVSKRVLLRFLHDIGHGLKFMHSKSIAHCDMKPANVLMDMDERGVMFCVLNDFGLSQVAEGKVLLVKAFKAVGVVGFTPSYAAPELLSRDPFYVHANMKALDVYAYAVILFQVMTRLDQRMVQYQR